VPRLRPFLVILLCCAGVVVAGCGSSAKGPRAVQLSLTAPVDGAAVDVSSIEVLGTIEPKDAKVVVSGKRALVVNGMFKRPVSLHKRLTHIKIVASAPGYVTSTTETSVSYRPRRQTGSATAGVTVGGPAASGLAPPDNVVTGTQADFVAGCSSGGTSVAGCTCMYQQLKKSGFDSVAKWKAVVERWRRSFLSRGVIAFPRPLRLAVINCASLLTRQ
jgi:hypothetical protein